MPIATWRFLTMRKNNKWIIYISILLFFLLNIPFVEIGKKDKHIFLSKTKSLCLRPIASVKMREIDREFSEKQSSAGLEVFDNFDNVKVTKIWRIKPEGWILENLRILDRNGQPWNIICKNEDYVPPVTGAYVIKIPNGDSLGMKEEVVQVIDILPLLARSSQDRMQTLPREPHCLSSPSKLELPETPDFLGPFGIHVVCESLQIYIVPDTMIEAARLSGIGGADIGTLAVHVGEQAIPVLQEIYAQRFLKFLEEVDRALYIKLIAESNKGFDRFNSVYFKPGNILLLASRIRDNTDAVRLDLGHEVFEQMVRTAPHEQHSFLKGAYEILDRDSHFREGNLHLFGDFQPYRKQILQGDFSEEFWTWVAWPDFGDSKLNSVIPEKLKMMIDACMIKAVPEDFDTLNAATSLFYRFKKYSEKLTDKAVEKIVAIMASDRSGSLLNKPIVDFHEKNQRARAIRISV